MRATCRPLMGSNVSFRVTVAKSDETQTNLTVSREPCLLSNRGLAIKDLVMMWWSASARPLFVLPFPFFFLLFWDGKCEVRSEQKSSLITCKPYRSFLLLLLRLLRQPSTPLLVGWGLVSNIFIVVKFWKASSLWMESLSFYSCRVRVGTCVVFKLTLPHGRTQSVEQECESKETVWGKTHWHFGDVHFAFK